MNGPIVFEPVYQRRVWGGRTLETRFGRGLPDGEAPFGESWELSDRPEADNRVRFPESIEGHTLGELWRERRTEVFGASYEGMKGPFPLLVKILDARDRLSVQVHPPAGIADELGGEPKTEMWYIADAEPGAVLYVGLKDGVSHEAFKSGIADGRTEEQVHQLDVAPGDFIFIPSGRLHAIGAGLLIYEIQQNSDTTYRVFDWNRVGLDGNPRELHVDQSLKCIDFNDVEPGLGCREGETLVRCPEFVVEEWRLDAGQQRSLAESDRFAVVTVVKGRVTCGAREFGDGDFFLVPAGCEEGIRAVGKATVLVSTLP